MIFDEVKLKKIATILNGRAYKQNELLEDGKYKVLRVGNFFTSDKWYFSDLELDENKYCDFGDLLYAWSANFGPKIWNEGKTIFHYHIWKIELKENIDKNYLFYYLKFITDKLKNSTHGSVMMHLTKVDMENQMIRLPNHDNQKKIGEILSNIDSKIELNNKINDNLLKLNNQLYEEYFINNINENAYEINLKDLIKVVNGYSYKGSELTDKSDIGLATIKNFERKGGFKEDGFKPLNPQKIKDEQIVEKNDILVACTDLTQQADIIGNAVLLLGKAEYKKVIISMDLVKIIPKDNIDKYVVFSILNSREFKNFALGYKSGTTVLHLNKKCFDDFIIKLPANDKLDVFCKMVKTNYEKISNILEENRRLEKLRDTLLPKLMNGEIDLDKIEI